LDLIVVLGLALGLAMDAFSVAMATGAALGVVAKRQTFRLSFHFGLFQFLMPVIGWFAGTALESLIFSFDHWIAFALLAYIGGKMIYESVKGDDGAPKGDPTRGMSLVALSVATSIDALAVGLSLGLLDVDVLFPAAVIGVVAAALTLVGLHLGRFAGRWLGPWMERVGGLVLIGIGVRIVLQHTLGL
jgi:manganese efflux pump family protein